MSKLEQLTKELKEAQEKRNSHWNKLQLSHKTEQLLRKFAEEQIEEEQSFSNSVNFIVQCLLKYNSKNKLKIEETFVLFLNLYSEFIGSKYKLYSEDAIIKLIANKISDQKLHRAVLITILKNNFLKKRQEKYNYQIKEFKKFVEKEKEKIAGKKQFFDQIDSVAYKIFLSEKEQERTANKITAKKQFVLKPTKKLKVAVILDEFSFNCFKDEFEALVITPQDWKEKFSKELPDLFFCESAWSGSDSNTRPWKGRIYTSTNFKSENRKELLEILDFCKNSGIPTIFWNKEDPTHYPDRVHDFVKTAALFDFIFTTAEECVEYYKKDYGLKNVYALPFATTPKMFNPIDKNKRSDSIIFAGSWYANHIQRSKDMENILDEILKSHELKIVDRYYGTTDELHLYPEKYNNLIQPSVPFTQMPELYKESKIALTFNTVKDSKTMFARRAFELMSSNTLVLSNSSEGMDYLLKDLFLDIEKDPNILTKISPNEVDKIRSKALNYVLSHHTYRHRWNYILEKINYKTISDHHTVTIVAIVKNEDEIEKLAGSFKQSSDNTKFLIILDDSIDRLKVKDYIFKYNSNLINVAARDYLERYGVIDNLIETTHFFLIENSLNEYTKLADKLLAHSYYMNELCAIINDEFKYKFKKGFLVKNVFAGKSNFKQMFNLFNEHCNEVVYCLDSNIEGVK
ncbi:glycosyltransferase [Acinetobacter soli]|uniref:CgeB family protein n=1 Tax=Acinetobacter soli TaxID=487316 RepID=UPI002812C185|nr:glycosyltransferase [Acinetobacter soli]MDQ9833082.1 glycosyltransferase [Acinetobacter soli]